MDGLLLNLFQVRLRASEAPEGHAAEGTVRIEPVEVHPGEQFQVVVDIAFTEGGPPAGIRAKVSPPEDFTSEEPVVELRDDGATVTIPSITAEEVELGTYYAQVVYSDEAKEHFEAEAPLEVKRHWVRIRGVTSEPSRASPGDQVTVTVDMTFEGATRVRGHVRGRLVPEDWDGEDSLVLKLPRERSSVATERQESWRLRLPSNAMEAVYHADVEFGSQEGTARRRERGVLQVVPVRGLEATRPVVEPRLLPPGDPVTVSTTVTNVGREPLAVRVGCELFPDAGGASVELEERGMEVAPGATAEASWTLEAPERGGEWSVQARARADRTEGADPPAAVLDVRPPHQVEAVGAVPSRPWAAPGDLVEVTLQLEDVGSRPGHEASVRVRLVGEAGESSETSWRGRVEAQVSEATVEVTVPQAGEGVGEGDASNRFELVIQEEGGRELLRVPGAVAKRRRVVVEPTVVRDRPDPLRIGDCLLPGERVQRTIDTGELTMVELSSGARLYARGDLVVGVDPEAPMDGDFWDQALDADLRTYTEIHGGLDGAAVAARAEAEAMRGMAEDLGGGDGRTALVEEAVKLNAAFGPGPAGRKGLPQGQLGPLASWLADADGAPGEARELVGTLRRLMSTHHTSPPTGDAASAAAGSARVAAACLDRLVGDIEAKGGLGEADLVSMAAQVAAVGIAQAELYRLRELDDPWASKGEAGEAQRGSTQANMVQLASLIELISRHRARRAGCRLNIAQRAARAAVVRDLEVQVGPVEGHAGDACQVEFVLVNGSPHPLDLRLNVALPSGAWTVLEPQARGRQGLMFVGPVHIEGRSTERLQLALYVPTTARRDEYVVPVEVTVEPREIEREQGGRDG